VTKRFRPKERMRMDSDCKPVFLMAGGRLAAVRRGPDPLLEEALSLCAIPAPEIAYVGAASGDNPVFRTMMAKMLQGAGSGKIMPARLCGSGIDPQTAMGVVADCPVVFMSGGDVEEGMRVVEQRKFAGFLRNQYQEGKLFIGASAGSIMLAKGWVRWVDPDDESSAELFPCLGIAQVYCDTHDEEDGWEELRSLSRLVPDGAVCYGISSGAALLAYPDGTVEFRGEVALAGRSLPPA
jgi:cyanophycinase-like exopeptidase